MINEIDILKQTEIPAHKDIKEQAEDWNLHHIANSGSWVGEVCDVTEKTKPEYNFAALASSGSHVATVIQSE